MQLRSRSAVDLLINSVREVRFIGQAAARHESMELEGQVTRLFLNLTGVS
jgi:hypothetical protein